MALITYEAADTFDTGQDWTMSAIFEQVADNAPGSASIGSYLNSIQSLTLNFDGQTCTFAGGDTLVQNSTNGLNDSVSFLSFPGSGCSLNGDDIASISVTLNGGDAIANDQLTPTNLTAPFTNTSLDLAFANAITGQVTHLMSTVSESYASFAEEVPDVPLPAAATNMGIGLAAVAGVVALNKHLRSLRMG